MTETAIATFLWVSPAESAKLFLRDLLVLCPVRVLRRGCSSSHFTDEEMESQGFAQGLHSAFETTAYVAAVLPALSQAKPGGSQWPRGGFSLSE